MRDKPEFVARKSAWAVCRFWEFLVFWLIVPLLAWLVIDNVLEKKDLVLPVLIGWFAILVIIFVCKIIEIKCQRVEFYRDRVVEKKGVFDIEKKINVFTAVLAANVEQSFWGRICNYGEVKVDMVGPWDVDLKKIKKPRKLQNYLEKRIARVRGMHQFMPNM